MFSTCQSQIIQRGLIFQKMPKQSWSAKRGHHNTWKERQNSMLQQMLFLHSLSFSFYLPKKYDSELGLKDVFLWKVLWYRFWKECVFSVALCGSAAVMRCFDVVGKGTVSSAFWALTVCLYALFILSLVKNIFVYIM